MQAAGLRTALGVAPQVAQEQATKVARADTEALGKSLNTPVFEPTFADQLQGTRNGVVRSYRRVGSRRAFWTASQAGAKTGFGRKAALGK